MSVGIHVGRSMCSMCSPFTTVTHVSDTLFFALSLLNHPNNLTTHKQPHHPPTTMGKPKSRRHYMIRATRRLAHVVGGVSTRPSRRTHQRALFKEACAKVSDVLPSLDPEVAGALEESASALAALSDFSEYHTDFTSCFKEALSILAWVGTPRALQARIALRRYAAALARTRL